MALTVYQYKKCSTCVKALKYLDAKGVDYTAIDITEQAPTQTELNKMLEHFELKRIFNTSGVVYRELKVSAQLKAGMTQDEAIELLASNGRLVKRPFLLTDTAGLVGFKIDEWDKVFG